MAMPAKHGIVELRFVPINSIKVRDERGRKEFGDLQELGESIKEKGMVQPLTIDTDGYLVTGERRLRAAKEVGVKQVPVVVRKIKDEMDYREIELIENLLRKDMSWDEETDCIAKLHKLYTEKYGDNWGQHKTAQLLGRSVGGISNRLKLHHAIETIPQLRDCKTQEDANRAIRKLEERALLDVVRKRQEEKMPTTDWMRTADANFKIGDAFAGLADLRDTGVIHLIEVDTPYGIGLKEVKARKEKGKGSLLTYNEWDEEAFMENTEKLAAELYRVAGRNCWMIYWFGYQWMQYINDCLVHAGWLVDIVPGIWTKESGQTQQPDKYLARCHEPFFICRKGNPALMQRGRSNVFQYKTVSPAKKYHATQRPLEMMMELLKTFAHPESIVLVPFLGSGTTLRAAYWLQMKGFGWELDEKQKEHFMAACEVDFQEMLQQKSVEKQIAQAEKIQGADGTDETSSSGRIELPASFYEDEDTDEEDEEDTDDR